MTNNLSGQINVPSTSAGTLTGAVNTNSGVTAVVNSTGIPMVGPSAFTKGNPGTTFIPVPEQISPYKVELSWTNDGGRPNPDTVTVAGVEGPQGIQGIQGPQGIQGERGIQGEKGDQGEQGIPGDISASDVNGIGKDGQPTTQDVINLQKQNNLIAGENIFIEEDVISAKIIPVYVGAEDGSIVMNTNTIRLLGEQSVITLNLNPPIDTTIKNSISIEFYSGETPTVFNISEDIQMKDLIPESNKTYEIDFWYRTNKTDSDWRWVGIWKEFEEAN